MQLFLQACGEFRQPGAPFHGGRSDQSDDEGAKCRDREHDHDRADAAGHAIAFEEGGDRGQHGTDHEGHDDRQEEGLCEVEHSRDGDHEQADQRDRHHLLAADQRRVLDLGTKGSGQTPWSRQGDGRLTLKGGVREVLATAMLEALGVPTSRCDLFASRWRSCLASWRSCLASRSRFPSRCEEDFAS